MTAQDISAAAQLLDTLRAAAFSGALWLLYDLLVTALPLRGRLASALFHLLFFAAAGAVGFCFIAGATSLHVPRWYLALGFGLGAAAYYRLLSRPVRSAVRALGRALRWLLRPVRALLRWLLQPLAWLQKRVRMMYNAFDARRNARCDAREKQSHGGEPKQQNKKQPIPPYTQT